jgi:dTMP kinase
MFSLIMPSGLGFEDGGMQKRGFFVCMEGLDGCGKTTQARLLAKRLKKNYSAVYTAEPSNGRIGRFIKQHCLRVEERGSSVVEALLFAADRLEHLQNEVLPRLDEGKLVISDRYVYSSLAYQGAAGVDLDWIRRINAHAIRPDLAIFVDVAPETVVQRLKPRRSVMENLETQRKVREVYLNFVKEGELLRVDGNASRRKVAEEILKAVEESLENVRQ